MIHVFGGIFLDIYIDKKEIHNSNINFKIGGSGFNIYNHLKTLGDNVAFHGTIGNDQSSETILNLLNRYNHEIKHLNKINGSSGIITYVNNEAFAVQRGVNNNALDLKNIQNKNYAVITTEIPKESIREILTLDFDYYFIDIGPRPFILEDIKFPKNTLFLGNKNESEIFKVDVVKLQEQGAKWNNLLISGNGITYQKSIGSGDLFTASFIHSYIHKNSKRACLKFAIDQSEEYLNKMN